MLLTEYVIVVNDDTKIARCKVTASRVMMYDQRYIIQGVFCED